MMRVMMTSAPCVSASKYVTASCMGLHTAILWGTAAIICSNHACCVPLPPPLPLPPPSPPHV